MTSRRPLALIVCRAHNGVIGAHGSIPWHIPEDLARFRSLTLGHTLLFGRRTFLSLPKPLDQRRIIVLSRDPSFSPPNVTVARSLDEALTAAYQSDPCPFVCGGNQLYQQTLPLATVIYLTQLSYNVPGDTFFPDLNLADWQLIEEKSFGSFSFLTLQRV